MFHAAVSPECAHAEAPDTAGALAAISGHPDAIGADPAAAMTLIALKDIPDGTKAGTTFTRNPILGRLLVQFGVAREVVDDDAAAPTPVTRSRGRYRRRDLRADQ